MLDIFKHIVDFTRRLWYGVTMTDTNTTLPDNPEELKKIILRMQRDQQRYEQEIDLLHEKVRLLNAQLFGKKSEKDGATSHPLPLFDMPEPEEMPEEEVVEVPAHTRQEKQFERLGAEIPRQTMCNWAMKAAEACKPLLNLLHKEIRSGPLINIDETTVQVLDEPGRSPTTKSYMWICRGGPLEQPGLMYHYAPSRSTTVAKALLADYQGVVQSDGYNGYDFLDKLDDIDHAGCWAHARRKFTEAEKGSGKKGKPGSVEVALSYIRKMYRIEKEGKRLELSPGKLVALRREKAKPILDQFFLWLSKKAKHVTPKSLLGIAVNYTLNQWHRLIVYLDHGEVTPDNNLAENAIRPFVVGRKNWLFSGNPEGAEASAAMYSLIETAKANGLEAYKYLRYLFEKLPFAETEDEYSALLPMNLKAEDLLIKQIATGV